MRRSLRLELLEDRCTPAILWVTTLIDETVDNGDTSLREAIAAAASSGDEIRFNDDLEGTIELSQGSLSVNFKNLSIIGNGRDSITIDANNGGSVLTVVGSTLTLDGLRLTGGNSTYGGGIYAYQNSNLNVLNSEITGNQASDGGGGICLYSGSLHVANSTISNNSVTGGGRTGGGLLIDGGAVASIFNTVISSNDGSSSGGGLYLTQSATSLTIDHATIINNVASTTGGGIGRDASAAQIEISNSVIADNAGGNFSGGDTTAESAHNFTDTNGDGGLSAGLNPDLGVTTNGDLASTLFAYNDSFQYDLTLWDPVNNVPLTDTEVFGPFVVAFTPNLPDTYGAVSPLDAESIGTLNSVVSHFYSDADGNYFAVLDPVAEGNLSIVLPSGMLQDLAGIPNEETSLTLEYVIPPEIVSIERGSVNGNIYSFVVTFSEQVTTSAAAFQASIGESTSLSIDSISPDGSSLSDTYTVNVLLEGGVGHLRLDVIGPLVFDSFGHVALSTTPLEADETFDLLPPVVETISVEMVADGTAVFRVTFSEVVSGVGETSFSALLDGESGILSVVSVVNEESELSTYYVTVTTPETDGIVQLALLTSGISDTSGNAMVSDQPALSDEVLVIDTTPPTFEIIVNVDQLEEEHRLVILLNSSEHGEFNVLDPSLIQVPEGWVISSMEPIDINGDGNFDTMEIVIDVDEEPNGRYEIDIPPDFFSDQVGNGSLALVLELDLTREIVVVIDPDGNFPSDADNLSGTTITIEPDDSVTAATIQQNNTTLTASEGIDILAGGRSVILDNAANVIEGTLAVDGAKDFTFAASTTTGITITALDVTGAIAIDIDGELTIAADILLNLSDGDSVHATRIILIGTLAGLGTVEAEEIQIAEGGNWELSKTSGVQLAGDVIFAGGTIDLELSNIRSAALLASVAGTVDVSDADLVLDLSDYDPYKGDTYVFLAAAEGITGNFRNVSSGTITQDGITFAVTYEDDAIVLKVVDKPAATNESFVSQLYVDLLGRNVDAGGLKTWTEKLAGGASQESVAKAIYLSTEHLSAKVAGYYQQFLHRDGEAGGIAYWAKKMQEGMSELEVIAGFLASDEYYSRCGENRELFLNSLYREIFDRDIDSAGFATWMEMLASSGNRRQVVELIQKSAEFDVRLIDGFYEDVLRRYPDAEGKANWQRRLDGGTMTPDQIDMAMYSSKEYYANT